MVTPGSRGRQHADDSRRLKVVVVLISKHIRNEVAVGATGSRGSRNLLCRLSIKGSEGGEAAITASCSLSLSFSLSLSLIKRIHAITQLVVFLPYLLFGQKEVLQMKRRVN